MNVDKAGESYWTQLWKDSGLNPPIEEAFKDINYYPYKRFHQYFKEHFSKFDTKGKALLEIGCGNSAWLPYFAKEFGFKVSGLDYSEPGCEQARKILVREGVEGAIFCADFFSPPVELLGNFDFAISMGVVEHFSDTSEVLKVFSKFLKKNGVLVTTVPNFSGMRGYMQKKFYRPEYDIHVPISRNYLEQKTKDAGLNILDLRHLTSFAFPMKLDEKSSFYKLQRMFVLNLCRVAKFIWMVENLIGPLPANEFFSADIMCIADKKSAVTPDDPEFRVGIGSHFRA